MCIFIPCEEIVHSIFMTSSVFVIISLIFTTPDVSVKTISTMVLVLISLATVIYFVSFIVLISMSPSAFLLTFSIVYLRLILYAYVQYYVLRFMIALAS